MDFKKNGFDVHSGEMTHIFRIDGFSYHYYTSEIKDLILRDKDKDNHIR